MSSALFRSKLVETALVGLLISAGVAVRLYHLTDDPTWVDEAESSINALTILQSGYPTDHYLGIPIYENTLIKPWEGHAEYEFKDISYSDRGVATYHGWLPLYSIAASFALQQIRPDSTTTPPRVHRDLSEWQRRTRAARLPSVFFGALFLALCYAGGTLLFGRDAGLTALLVGCVHQSHLDVCVRARYYSAVVLLSTLVLVLLWLMLSKGKWWHYIAGAGAFVLLFFTHLVTFAAGICVLSCLVPVLLYRQPGAIRKLAVFGAILLVPTVPWMLATGFFSGLGAIPPARSLLAFPADLFTYPLARAIYLVVFALFALVLLYARNVNSWIPARIADPLRQSGPKVALLSLWIVSGYSVFMLFMPAASFFPGRLNLSYWGPTLLLSSIFCAVVGRILWPRHSLLVSPALAVLLLALSGHCLGVTPSPAASTNWDSLSVLARRLDAEAMPPGSKLYAAPNAHLVLTFYTGLPFQSVAPIRKSFLDTYRGDLLYVEPASFLPPDGTLAPDHLSRAAQLAGRTLASTEVLELSRWLRTADYRLTVHRDILSLPQTDEPVPVYAADALAQARARAREAASDDTGTLVLRGFHSARAFEWRAVFFYRFVNPLSRRGLNLNYAEPLRGANADILLDEGWVIYRSAHDRSREAREVQFRVLP